MHENKKSKPKPQVSVIIPTHNQCALLRGALDKLGEQTYPAEKMEAIVVADGCIDETLNMLQKYRAPYPLRVLEQPGRGAAATRNRGAEAARGDLLIFVDEDIEASPGLVQAHVDAHKGQRDAVVIGYLPPVYPEPPNLYHIEARNWWENKYYKMQRSDHRFHYLDFVSGNFSMKAGLFERVGGFDTTFPGCGGEDYEFGVRLLKAGATFQFVPEALGYHRDKTGLERSFRRARKEGQADVMIGLRHPELRPALFLFKIYSPWTRLARVLVKLLFKRPQLADRLAGLYAHKLRFYEHMRLRERWRKLHGVLKAYWYWRGALDELGDKASVDQFFERTTPLYAHLHLELDLAEGLEQAEQRLDSVRPESVTIKFGDHYIGDITPEPATESLRGAHLRSILARKFTWPLLKAMALEQAGSSVFDSNGVSSNGKYFHEINQNSFSTRDARGVRANGNKINRNRAYRRNPLCLWC
jgi:glycosyltransferase involved in cell wall biosynthesis